MEYKNTKNYYKQFSKMKQISNIIKFFFILSLFLCVFGCSFMSSPDQNLLINSVPQGAKVSINGVSIGTTPMNYQIVRNSSSSVVIEKDGYKPYSVTPLKKLSPIGILDTVGGAIILIPLVGLVSPGAWELDPVNVTLYKMEGSDETDDNYRVTKNYISSDSMNDERRYSNDVQTKSIGLRDELIKEKIKRAEELLYRAEQINPNSEKLRELKERLDVIKRKNSSL